MNNKIGLLIEVFDEYDLSFALLSETWFKTGQNLERELAELEMGKYVMAATHEIGKKNWRHILEWTVVP